MAGEFKTGVVDDALVYRGRDHGVEDPVLATIDGLAQGVEDIGGVFRIRLTAMDITIAADRQNSQRSGVSVLIIVKRQAGIEGADL